MEQTDEKSALAKILEILNKAAVIHPRPRSRVSRGSPHGDNQRAPLTGRPFCACGRIRLAVLPSNTLQEDRCARPLAASSPLPLSPAAASPAKAADRPCRRNYQVGNFQQIEVAGPYDVEVRTGSNPASPPRAAKSCSNAPMVEVQGDKLVIQPEHHGFFHFGWSTRQRQLHRHRAAAARRTHRRIGRHPRRQGRRRRFEGTVAGSGGLDVASIDVQSLKLSIAGSGGVKAGGGQGARSREYDIAGSGDIDAGGVRRSRPRCRSPDRAASRPMPPGPPTSTSWARATSISPAAPNATSARRARATFAALKAALNHMRSEGARMRTFLFAAALARRIAAPAGPRPAISGSPASPRSASTGRTGSGRRPESRRSPGRPARAPRSTGWRSTSAATRWSSRPTSPSWGGYPGAEPGPVEVSIGTHDLSNAWLNGAGTLAIDRVKGLSFALSVQGAGAAEIGQADVDQLNVSVVGTASAKLAGRAEQADRARARHFSARCGPASPPRTRPSAPRARPRSTPMSATRANIDASGPATMRLTGRPACTCGPRLGDRQRLPLSLS